MSSSSLKYAHLQQKVCYKKLVYKYCLAPLMLESKRATFSV